MTEKRLEDMTLDELREAAESVSGDVVEQAQTEQVENTAQTETVESSDTNEPEQTEETLEQVRARLASAEKALRDTKAWGTQKAQEAAALRKAQEDAQRELYKPAILDANPELADAIRYVATDDSQKYAQEQNQAAQQWQDTVRAAIPDIDDLLENGDFMEAMKARAQNVDWSNPLIAIREVNTEIRARAAQAANQAATAARVDTKRSAASIPSGGTRQVIKTASAEEEQLRKFQNMSNDEIARYAHKVTMGQV
jgi:hypothetical protein